MVDLVGVLDQEERLHHVLDMREVGLPVGEVVIGLVGEVGGDAQTVHPGDEALPRLLVAQDEGEVDVAAVEGLEQCRLGRHRLGVATGLPLDQSPGIEPIGVGQLGTNRHRVMDREVDDLTVPRRFTAIEGQEDRDKGKAGGHVVRLVFRRPNGRDAVVVVAAAVEQSSGREGHEVGRLVPRPRAVRSEGSDRADDQLRERQRKLGWVNTEFGLLMRRGGQDEHVGRLEQVPETAGVVRKGEHDTALERVVIPERQAGACALVPLALVALAERSDPPGGRPLTWLDLDHIGPELSQ